MIHLEKTINNLLDLFTPKQKKVIMSRFGLKNGKKSTLQEIGDELGITRERVRQIQEQAEKKIREKVKAELSDFLDFVEKRLKDAGEVRRDDQFIKEIAEELLDKDTKHKEEKTRFLLLVAGTPAYHKEDDELHAFWYSNESKKKELIDFVKKIEDVLETSKEKGTYHGKEYIDHCTNAVLCHMLTIPKKFDTNAFGDFGMKEWPEINPKTIRDKVYLVLKKKNEPLHFEDIAKHIHETGLSKRKAHVQTVHNELIKDKRFVLVGRGMYGLQEHGFEPGTVREVIARLLKVKGPLSSTEVITMVNKERYLKENTILLNLQNKKYFKRLDNGKYHTKEA